MNRWKRRVLSVVLAVCLILCQRVYVFAWEPEESALQDSVQYGESGVEGLESLGQSSNPELEQETPAKLAPELEEPIEPKVEPESEEPAQPETATIPNFPEPQEIGESDTVYDEVELATWIEHHKNTGGTVSLGASVTITEDMGIYGIYEEIIIDTGEYGFVFDGGTLPSSSILITGEGVDMPVVDVWRTNSGNFWDLSWNNELMELNITATGRGGMGGIALRIMAADTKSISMDTLYEQGVIRSYGEGAIGLWLDVPMDAWCYRVEVFGDHSVAAYAPSGTNFTYCKLTAEGSGAVAVAGNDLLLDSCASSPTPSDVQNINRRAMEESFSRLYLPLEQNQYNLSEIMMLNTPTVFLDSNDGVISRHFAVYWDIDAYDDIDTSVLGKTMVSGTVAPALYGLGVFDEVPIELMVEVRNPDLPCISQIAVRELDGRCYARLNFWQDYEPTDESVILWRSDDEGETWWDTTHSLDILWSNDSVDFNYDELTHPIWFQLEMMGVGESNIAILDEKDGVFTGGNGGDRTGTDREGAGPVSGSKPGDGNGGEPSGGQSGGNIATPGEGEGSNVGDPTHGSGDKPKGNNGNTTDKDDKPGSDEGDTNGATPKTAPPDTADANITAWKPGLIPSVEPAVSTKANPEASEKLPTDENTEAVEPSIPEEPLPVIDEPLVFDPEQSAPEVGFSANALTIFFLGVTVLCIGVLLVLRSGWFERWRNGKD